MDEWYVGSGWMWNWLPCYHVPKHYSFANHTATHAHNKQQCSFWLNPNAQHYYLHGHYAVEIIIISFNLNRGLTNNFFCCDLRNYVDLWFVQSIKNDNSVFLFHEKLLLSKLSVILIEWVNWFSATSQFHGNYTECNAYGMNFRWNSYRKCIHIIWMSNLNSLMSIRSNRETYLDRPIRAEELKIRQCWWTSICFL